jgi:hypothetical protein
MYHLLTTLVNSGYVVHLADEHAYALGHRIDDLARGLRRQIAVSPEVERIAAVTHRQAHAARPCVPHGRWSVRRRRAGDQRVQNHRVPRSDVRDRAADLAHPAGVLVADDVRQRHAGPLRPAAPTSTSTPSGPLTAGSGTSSTDGRFP